MEIKSTIWFKVFVNVIAFQLTVAVWFVTLSLTNLMASHLSGSEPVLADYRWVGALAIALIEYFIRASRGSNNG